MMRQQIARVAAALALAGTLGAAQAQTPPDDSLYRALGGLPVLQKVVDDFMANMLADRRIKHTFAESNIERVKQKLVEQFCQLSGGGCIYTGDPMREVHQGLKLSNADFNALVEDLQLAMDANGISSHTQNRLLALLAPMQRETVSR
ncbi:group 1 truncated hemoglobin [Herbaspirillum sp. VT-16-41]|uniref:group I truncated hemoglobin n=1 Tax=Herbaspirillum sp. VT-16-41 TaxID=1953765 RepID=UPI000981B7BC|nr:group 1 truncated hemoglobin [Herbaspirillum sp. VT-16-41]ONN65927.1 group 1 truncated hemoglobin [Herbaspirillum sp. VT-16-41]